MKKSSAISLTLLTAVAALATSSCAKKEVRDCVDQNNRIVEDRFCDERNGQSQPMSGYPGGFLPYYWRYGGSSGGHIGDAVIGGGTSPTPGTRAVSGRSVSRGGFGSSFGHVGS